MKKFILIFILMLFASQAYCMRNYGNVRCKFVRYFNNDTIIVNIQRWPHIIGREIPVKINGLAMHMTGSNNMMAKKSNNLRNIIQQICIPARLIELKGMRRDNMAFRIIADVYVNGQNIADIIRKSRSPNSPQRGPQKGWIRRK